MHAVLIAVAIILAIHWAPLLLAAWRWPLRRSDWSILSALKMILGVVCWLIVVICLPIFANAHANGSGTGSPAGWYIIFSVATFGVVPVLIISAHIYAGRSAGYWYRRYRLRTR